MSCCVVTPVQPKGLGRLMPALGELTRHARRGLGECPAYAPYESPGGGCSNVPPDLNAFEYFKAGGQLDEETQTIVGWDGGGQPTLECPYGSELNPFTGRTECKSATEAKYTTSSGYVLRAGSNAAMSDIAAAAQREAAARGINVRCGSYPIGGDPITNEQRYAAGCVVGSAVIGGPDTFSASEMLTGGGMETLATQLGVSPFFKSSEGYQFTPPTSQQSQLQPIRTATTPTAPAQPPTTPAPAPTRPVSPAVLPSGAEIVSTVTDLASQAKAAVDSSGIPSWVIYAAGAGAVGLYFLGGKRR